VLQGLAGFFKKLDLLMLQCLTSDSCKRTVMLHMRCKNNKPNHCRHTLLCAAAWLYIQWRMCHWQAGLAGCKNMSPTTHACPAYVVMHTCQNNQGALSQPVRGQRHNPHNNTMKTSNNSIDVLK
jgi:hypothetical protein